MIAHPQIIHYPIALLSVALITDLVSYFWQKDFFNKMTLVLVILGVVAAFFAVQSGEAAVDNLNNLAPIKNLLEQHESAGDAVFIIFGLVLFLKSMILYLKKDHLSYKIIISLVILMGVFKIYQAGHFGGILVYQKGVGVQQIFENSETH